MTTHNSVQYALKASQTSAGTPLKPVYNRGKVRVSYGSIVASGQTLAENDLIKLFDLPAGAVPLYYMARNGAFGASVTMDIGTSSTQDLYEAAVSISAASQLGPTPLDNNDILTAKTTIYAKLEGANPADDKALEIWLYWAIE